MIALANAFDNGYITKIRVLTRSIDVVEENQTRRKIFRHILEHGFGIFNEIWRDIGCSKANISWHLEKLKACGIVVEMRVMKYKVFYIKGFEVQALRRFICEKKVSGGYRWERVRRVLYDLCYVDDAATVASRYGLRVEEVESLRNLLRASCEGLRGARCVEFLARLGTSC